MTKSISRSQFLRGDFNGQRRFIRPPWSPAERAFVGECTRCNACIDRCPENIITTDPKGFPQINYSKGECTFCGDCAKACEDKVLDSSLEIPWTVSATINNDCLPFKGVVCGRCAEECETIAISMKLVAGGISLPVLKTDSCNGCGACFRVCPTQSIQLSYGAKQ